VSHELNTLSDAVADRREPVLKLEDVRKSYRGGVHALRGVDLRVSEGELVAVVGPSGSGKTTLLQIMGTLDRPTSGIVTIAEHDAGKASDRQLAALRANSIGFVFQQFFLLDGLSAVQNVAGGLLYTGTPAREREARARLALQRVGMEHRLSHQPNQLSGGERQRVAIARAIIGDPSIVFADEPTGNLDSARGAEIIELLRELNGEGATLVVITHDLEVAASLPRQVEMRDGQIISDSAQAEPLTLAEAGRRS